MLSSVPQAYLPGFLFREPVDIVYHKIHKMNP